jgi:hypothetical protein
MQHCRDKATYAAVLLSTYDQQLHGLADAAHMALLAKRSPGGVSSTASAALLFMQQLN